MPIKRYDLVTNYRCGSSIEEMEPADDGEWMRYEDHAGWQPIETAPMDGTRVLLYDQSWCGGAPKIEVSYWQPYRIHTGAADADWQERGGWCGITKATHWMPLPAPPPIEAV